MSTCPNCEKEQISPEERCDCRLDWQIKKSFQLQEKLNTAIAHLKEIDAGWCPHDSIRLDSNPDLHRDFCSDCHLWVYRDEINPAKEALIKLGVIDGEF